MFHRIQPTTIPLAICLLACCLMQSASTAAGEDQPVVFISAFTAGEKGAIHAYQLDLQTGGLKLLQRTNEVEHPFFLAISPKGRFLYSIHATQFGGDEHEEIMAFKIEGRSGRLELLNRQSALGSASCYLETDATGKTLVVANYSTGSVAALPIGEDGSLGKASSFMQHAGSSVDPKRQQGPYAHCIVVSPDNRFAYAADLGLDQVLGYRLDAGAAKLSPNRQPFVRTPPGAGPRHLAFHPDGTRLYAINELKNSITAFDYEAETGMLTERQTISTLPEDFDGTSYCADLKITPDGRYLYGTNRGHDSLAAYRIGADGRLKLIEIQASRGKGPQNLLITPDSKLLLCANMPGKNVAAFRIDAETGRLEPLGEPTPMPMPSCIRLLPAGAPR